MNKQQDKSQIKDNKKNNLWNSLTTKEEEKISGGKLATKTARRGLLAYLYGINLSSKEKSRNLS